MAAVTAGVLQIITDERAVAGFIKVGKALVDHMEEAQRRNLFAAFPWLKPFFSS